MPASPDDREPPDDAALERLVLRAVGGVVAVLLAAGVARVVTVAGDPARDGADRGTGPPPAARTGTGPGTGTGPPAGASLATYVATRGALLDSLAPGETVAAAVSFAAYVTVNEARVLVAGAGLRLDLLLVAAPGAHGEAVEPDRVGEWATDAVAAAEDERAELERLLPTVDDPDFDRQYRLDIERLRLLAASVSPDADIVFGAVVTGPARALRALAAKAAIRLVDPGVSAGIRPEQDVTAGEPRYRP